MCDPKKSGIPNDPRKVDYCEVERWTNINFAKTGMTGSYRHSFPPCSVEELVCWDSRVRMSGCIGKLEGDIYRRWKPDDGAFCPLICQAQTFSQWLQVSTYSLVEVVNNTVSTGFPFLPDKKGLKVE